MNTEIWKSKKASDYKLTLDNAASLEIYLNYEFFSKNMYLTNGRPGPAGTGIRVISYSHFKIQKAKLLGQEKFYTLYRVNYSYKQRRDSEPYVLIRDFSALILKIMALERV